MCHLSRLICQYIFSIPFSLFYCCSAFAGWLAFAHQLGWFCRSFCVAKWKRDKSSLVCSVYVHINGVYCNGNGIHFAHLTQLNNMLFKKHWVFFKYIYLHNDDFSLVFCSCCCNSSDITMFLNRFFLPFSLLLFLNFMLCIFLFCVMLLLLLFFFPVQFYNFSVFINMFSSVFSLSIMLMLLGWLQLYKALYNENDNV